MSPHVVGPWLECEHLCEGAQPRVLAGLGDGPGGQGRFVKKSVGASKSLLENAKCIEHPRHLQDTPYPAFRFERDRSSCRAHLLANREVECDSPGIDQAEAAQVEKKPATCESFEIVREQGLEWFGRSNVRSPTSSTRSDSWSSEILIFSGTGSISGAVSVTIATTS